MTEPIKPSLPIPLDASVSFLEYPQLTSEPKTSDFLLGNVNAPGISNTDWINATLKEKDNAGNYVNSIRIPDSVPTATQSPVDTRINPSAVKAKPNPLNAYANYTYHIVFSVASEESAKNVTASTMKTLNKIVIAETGKTAGFNITRFSLENSVSPSLSHQNINSMNWKMTISEPFGLTLTDYIISAAKNLQIKNVNRFPFFIELWFNGYNEDGTLTKEQIEGTYKAWRVLWLESSLQTNQVGTTYELAGCADNDLVNSNQFSLTRSMLNLADCRTFQDVIDRLTEALNKDAQNADNTKNTTEYSFEVPSIMKNWKITLNQEDSQRDASNLGVNLSITRGQDIASFIVTAMSKCGNEADNFLYGSTNNGSPTIDSHGLARFVQVIPEMTIGPYQDELKDYKRKIKYRIVPYYTPRCVKDPADAAKQKRLENQVRKFNWLTDHNMIAKKYEYYYTGKNTEVIKFDINVQNFWQLTLPNYYNANTYSDTTIGAVVDPNSYQFKKELRYVNRYQILNEITARAAQVQDIINGVQSGLTSVNSLLTTVNGLGGSFSPISGAVNTISGSISNTTNSLQSVSGQIGNMSNSIQSLGSGGLNSIITQASSVVKQFGQLATLTSSPILQFDAGNTNTLQNLYNNASNLLSNTATQQPLPYISPTQVKLQSEFLESLSEPGEIADDPLPVPFFADPTPTFQQTMFNGANQKTTVDANTQTRDYPNSPGIFSKTVGNIYDDQFMLNIEIEIRGDPWWIGMTNLELNQYLAKYDSNTGTISADYTVDYANFVTGENMFFMTFRTATNYDEETGLMLLDKGSEYFNGLYAVTTVENKFENGNFTQILKAYKEPFSQTVDKLLTPTR